MEGIDGRTVPLQQYDLKGPKDKPIWMWCNGIMHLGEWKSYGPNGGPYFHGFGACYYNGSEANEGRVYIGEWKGGNAHGSGKLFWLESAPIWKENRLAGSPIVERTALVFPMCTVERTSTGKVMTSPLL
jgi:hypothetical protein